MIEQLKTIRLALDILRGAVGHEENIHTADLALTALTQLEAMAGEQELVAWVECDGELVWNNREAAIGRNLYTAAPVAQQPQAEVAHPAVKPDTLVNRGALQMALNVLRRAGKDEVADELEKTIQQPQAEAVLRKLEWAEVRHEYREAEYFCPICDRDKRQGHEAGCELAAALTPQQAEAVPLTHVLVPVDEPTDEMVDAACAAVDGLCRVDFVRAYVAAFAHLKAGYRDESYWCGWNAAIKFQQAESAHQYNLANRLRVHLANRHTLTGPEFKDGVAGILAEYYTAPQQAEAVPTFDEQLREVAKRAIPQQAEAVPFNHATQLQIAYVKGLGDGAMQAEAVPPDVEVIRKALERAFIMGQNYWADADSESYSANKRSDVTRQKFNAMRDEVCAAIAQQKGGV